MLSLRPVLPHPYERGYGEVIPVESFHIITSHPKVKSYKQQTKHPYSNIRAADGQMDKQTLNAFHSYFLDGDTPTSAPARSTESAVPLAFDSEFLTDLKRFDGRMSLFQILVEAVPLRNKLSSQLSQPYIRLQ
jgi:hypothetical protein